MERKSKFSLEVIEVHVDGVMPMLLNAKEVQKHDHIKKKVAHKFI